MGNLTIWSSRKIWGKSKRWDAFLATFFGKQTESYSVIFFLFVFFVFWKVFISLLVLSILFLFIHHIKGCLRYKMKTSQNVSSEAQIKNFLFRWKIMFRSQDIQVFVFLTISWDTKSVTSWWVLIHETGCIFEYIFWTTTHKVTKLGKLINISKCDNFQ